MSESRNTQDIIWREDLYPRIAKSPETVQKYADDLTVLPPIEINQNDILIDGWHRWTAHKKANSPTISVIITQTTSDAHLLELAIERNAAHGLQLSQEDKQDMARRIYNSTAERARADKKKDLARILSVSLSTVESWLSRIDKDTKDARNKRIFAKWLACWTREEIALSEDLSDGAISEIWSEFPELEKLTKPAQTLATYAEPEWKPPIYNIWKQQEKTNGVKHFGNSEIQWLDNLLYLYTEPFDVVVDPFAGGGSTIELCKRRMRRYYASDRKPIVEREDIRQHDLLAADGAIILPSVPRWKDVGLVYLDPPYWKQAEGQYSKDATDLANITIEQFNGALSGIIKAFASKLKTSVREKPAYIALIIQPTQWKADNKSYTDHVGDMLRMVKLPVDMRYSVPYESQQANAQMVIWAKANRKCLVLTREIVVWEVS
jgi:DNA modification methylase